jgi:hypothetical protein
MNWRKLSRFLIEFLIGLRRAVGLAVRAVGLPRAADRKMKRVTCEQFNEHLDRFLISHAIERDSAFEFHSKG